MPKWVKDATKTKSEHEIVIGYVDVRKTNPASLVLIVVDDKRSMAPLVSFQKSQFAYRGKNGSRADLSPTLKESFKMPSCRPKIEGLCRQRMFNDAEPVIEKLDNYVSNSVQNIMMFQNSESAVNQLENFASNARQSCEAEFRRELAELEAAERARLEAIRKREAQRRQAAIVARAKKAAAEAAFRRKAFDDLPLITSNPLNSSKCLKSN